MDKQAYKATAYAMLSYSFWP